MRELSIILVIFSIIIAGASLFIAISAIQESAIIALACFVGILARIAQATAHHNELRPKKDSTPTP